ncbi:MAG: peroxiredoxin [Verrucomicrobiales bacterium]|jgi:peroxiredoxin
MPTSRAMEITESQPIGGNVSDFELLPVSGSAPQGLTSILANKKGAVIVFWSAVCSHCRRYDDYLQKFSMRYPDLGLGVIGAREKENAEVLTKAIADRSLRFPILHDINLKVAHAWLVCQTPRAFLINADQHLLYRGAIDNFKYPMDPEYAPYLDHALEDFLSGQAVRRSETPGFGCPTESVYYHRT